MKKFALILGLLVIAIILSCGCTTTTTSSSSSSSSLTVTGPAVIAVDGTFKLDESNNPISLTVELTAENRGNFDAKDVQADIYLIYDDEAILTDRANFGDIQAGKTNTLQSSYSITAKDNFDSDKFRMKFGDIYANGEKLVDKE